MNFLALLRYQVEIYIMIAVNRTSCWSAVPPDGVGSSFSVPSPSAAPAVPFWCSCCSAGSSCEPPPSPPLPASAAAAAPDDSDAGSTFGKVVQVSVIFTATRGRHSLHLPQPHEWTSRISAQASIKHPHRGLAGMAPAAAAFCRAFFAAFPEFVSCCHTSRF